MRRLKITRIPDLVKEEVEIESFINQISQLFSETFKDKGINIEIKVNPKNLHFVFDRKMIEQVIINLIKNSIEALENRLHKVIKIGANETNNSLEIIIKDTGIGMKNEIKEDVFIPFFTTKDNGSGIGLSLSKEIMQKHQGDIFFNSEYDIGTTFYLRFQ